MTENKLSEKELNEIREEAESYRNGSIESQSCNWDEEMKSKYLLFLEDDCDKEMSGYIAALTREREGVKGLVSTLEEIATFYSVGHPVREMIEKTLTNYQKSKEQ